MEHPPWRTWTAAGATLTMDVGRLYGRAFAPALSQAPASALIADGSPVVVHAPRRLSVAHGAVAGAGAP